MNDWKTTTCGLVLALGAGLLAVSHYPGAPPNVASWTGMIGAGLVAVGGVLGGYNAKDKDPPR